jgi:hypothetical protein
MEDYIKKSGAVSPKLISYLCNQTRSLLTDDLLTRNHELVAYLTWASLGSRLCNKIF